MQPKRHAGFELPQPDADSLEHSRRVANYLRGAIDESGGISFGEFMHHALYAPGLGYYDAGAQKFGWGGDFVTAPEVSSLFGNVLARQCAPSLRNDPSRELLELGPGSGALMLQLLTKLEELDALPARYCMFEVSAELRERQQRRLEAELPRLAGRVTWPDRVPTHFRGVVVANEVVDALPVERFVRTVDGVDQLRVVAAGDGFAFEAAPAPAWLSAAVAAIETGLDRRLPEGYVSELSAGLRDWVGDIAACLDEALVFLFDYGVTRHEYYAPDRSGGWLRCHFRHRAHDDPLRFPGIQDLSAWVDFTALAEAAATNELRVEAYVTQSRFLLDGGIAEELTGLAEGTAEERLALSQQVKLLTLPGEMGEHFKCLGLSRGAMSFPDTFALADRSHAL